MITRARPMVRTVHNPQNENRRAWRPGGWEGCLNCSGGYAARLRRRQE